MATFKLTSSDSFIEFTSKMKTFPRLATGLTQKSTGKTFDALVYIRPGLPNLFVSFAKDVDKNGLPKQNWKHIERTTDFIANNAKDLLICTSQKFEDAECTVASKDKDGNDIYAYTLTWQSANSWQTIVIPGVTF